MESYSYEKRNQLTFHQVSCILKSVDTGKRANRTKEKIYQDRGEGKRGDSFGKKVQGEIPKRLSLKEAHRTPKESDQFPGALCTIL